MRCRENNYLKLMHEMGPNCTNLIVGKNKFRIFHAGVWKNEALIHKQITDFIAAMILTSS